MDRVHLNNELRTTCGVAFRTPYVESFLLKQTSFNAIEFLTENFLYTEGERRDIFDQLAKDRLVHLHGVSMNVGSFDDFDFDYLYRLKDLASQVSHKIISDHLSFTRLSERSSFDLLPIPKTKKMVEHIGDRVKIASEKLDFDLVLENISAYFSYDIDELSEVDFIHQLTDRYDVKLLLDLNNLFVTSKNLNFDPFEYLKAIPSASIVAYHIGGFEMVEGFHFDTHGAETVLEVRSLYKFATQRFGHKPTFLERDDNLPKDLSTLENELSLVLS